MASGKTRLDQLMVARGLAESRSKAQALIMAGEVRVGGEVQLRAALPVPDDANIEVAAALPYVSRGGYKLAHALDSFGLDASGLVALDAGASTGGFSDTNFSPRRLVCRISAIAFAGRSVSLRSSSVTRAV